MLLGKTLLGLEEVGVPVAHSKSGTWLKLLNGIALLKLPTESPSPKLSLKATHMAAVLPSDAAWWPKKLLSTYLTQAAAGAQPQPGDWGQWGEYWDPGEGLLQQQCCQPSARHSEEAGKSVPESQERNQHLLHLSGNRLCHGPPCWSQRQASCP